MNINPTERKFFMILNSLNKHLNFFINRYSMKILGFMIVLLLLIPISLAKTQTVVLNRGESTVIDGINVTLIDFIKKDRKVLICVNDEKTIISDDKRVNKVYIDMRSFRDEGVRLELEADCDDCIASDNAKCFLKKENNTESKIENDDLNETVDDEIIDDEFEDEIENKINLPQEKPYRGILQRFVDRISSFFR